MTILVADFANPSALRFLGVGVTSPLRSLTRIVNGGEDERVVFYSSDKLNPLQSELKKMKADQAAFMAKAAEQ
jgi:hypothetical protein